MQLQLLKIVSVVTALATLLLAACAGPQDTVASLLVTPGKYDLYKCEQIKQAIQANAAHETALQGLKNKAETGTAGPVVSAAVYEPNYLMVRGELNELRQAARDKHCDEPKSAGALPAPPQTSKPAAR